MNDRKSLFISVLILIVFLTSCSAQQSMNQSQTESDITSSEELTNDIEQSIVLDVRFYSNSKTINDAEISKRFTDLFNELRDINESTDEVVCLPDPGDQYEVAPSIIIRSESNSFRYHGTGTFAGYDDKKNAAYITLLDENGTKGYLILDGTELHSKVENFVDIISKLF